MMIATVLVVMVKVVIGIDGNDGRCGHDESVGGEGDIGEWWRWEEKKEEDEDIEWWWWGQ